MCRIGAVTRERMALTPLNGELPLLDPFEWGLEQFGIKRPQKSRELTEQTEQTQHTEHTETITVKVRL